jgi:hypothetical protein
VPTAWTLAPKARLAFAYRPDWPVVVGGFLFGIGAVVNGGCAVSTLTQLAMGDLGAGFALLGLGLGFALHELWIGPLLRIPLPRSSPLPKQTRLNRLDSSKGQPKALAERGAPQLRAEGEAGVTSTRIGDSGSKPGCYLVRAEACCVAPNR